jgi:hypothetical protein
MARISNSIAQSAKQPFQNIFFKNHVFYFLREDNLLKKKPGANPGPNPTIMSYNASVVNFNNATGSLAHFENKNIFFPFEKRSSLLQRWRCT